LCSDDYHIAMGCGGRIRRMERPPASIREGRAKLGSEEAQEHRQMKGFIVGVLVTAAMVALAIWGWLVLTQPRM
jgi:hypothetical protein